MFLFVLNNYMRGCNLSGDVSFLGGCHQQVKFFIFSKISNKVGFKLHFPLFGGLCSTFTLQFDKI